MKYYIQLAENGCVNAIVNSDTIPEYDGIQYECTNDPSAFEGMVLKDGKFYPPVLVADESVPGQSQPEDMVLV